MKLRIEVQSVECEISGTTARGAAGGQRTFHHLREDAAAPTVAGPGARAAGRIAANRAIESASEPECPIKAAALDRVRDELARYLARLGVGSEFQAVDFLNDLDRRGMRPSADVLDMRCTGGLFRQLVASGVLRVVGYRPNAGGNATQYSSTPRAVYIIEQHWMPEGADAE